MNGTLEKRIFFGFSMLCMANLACFFPDLLMGAKPTEMYYQYNISFRVSLFVSSIVWAFVARFVSFRVLYACVIGGYLLLFSGVVTSIATTFFVPVLVGCLCGIGLSVTMAYWFVLLAFLKERSQASIQGWQAVLSGGVAVAAFVFWRFAFPWMTAICIFGSWVEFMSLRRYVCRDAMADFCTHTDLGFEPMRRELREAVPPCVGFIMLALLYGAIAGVVLGNNGSPLGSLASITGLLLGASVFLVWLRLSRTRNYAAVAESILICVALFMPFVPVDLSVLMLSFGFQMCGLMLFSYCVDAFSARPRLILGATAVAYGVAHLVFLAGLYVPGQFGIESYTAFIAPPSLSVALAYVAFAAFFVLFVRTVRGLRSEISALEEKIAREAAEQTQPEAVALPDRGTGFDAACVVVANRYGLTKRETEIFGLLAHGRDAGFICDELYLARNTVKGYMKRIYAKLGIHSKQELINVAEGTMREMRGD